MQSSMAQLTSGMGSETYYPRVSVADFISDDPPGGIFQGQNIVSHQDIELGARHLDLLQHTDAGAVGYSAPVQYKNTRPSKENSDFDEVAL